MHLNYLRKIFKNVNIICILDFIKNAPKGLCQLPKRYFFINKDLRQKMCK